MENLDEFIQEFAEYCRLLIDKGIKRNQLIKIVDDCYKRDSKYIDILYNSTFGSFSLTNHFIDFSYRQQRLFTSLQPREITKHPERIFPAEYITNYGRHICYEFPYVACLVANYFHHRFHETCPLLRKLFYAKKTFSKLNDNLLLCTKYLNEHHKFGFIELLNQDTAFDIEPNEFTKDSLRKAVAHSIPRQLNEYESKIISLEEVIISEYGMKSTVLNEILISYEETISVKTYPEFSFHYMLQCHGFSEGLWTCGKTRFDYNAMIFLHNKISNRLDSSIETNVLSPSTTLPLDRSLLQKVYTEIGLLAAAESSCKLEISRISDNVEWEIINYDGLEHIRTS